MDGMPASLLVALLAVTTPARAAVSPLTLVACAPGYPGNTAEAQPSMDALAGAVAEAAGWREHDIAATYQETEQGGLERLSRPGATVALVPLPFLAQHGASSRLSPRLQVEEKGAGLSQVWSLVAKRGRVASPAALGRFTVMSTAGYAPAFVRGAVRGWGEIPPGARIVQSSQVLSGLRRAAAGDDVALLLDGAQTAALPTLPFASDLEVVARSRPLPVAFVCEVDERLAPTRWKALEDALLKLSDTPAGAAALEGIRMVRFVRPDPAALAVARSFEKTDGR